MSTESDTPNPSPRPRRGSKRRGRLLLTIIFLGLLLAAVSLSDRIFRQFLAPWSRPAEGRPALLGSWAGPVTLENGVTGTLQLTLVDNLGEQESWFDLLLEGSAHYCLGDTSGDFEVYGDIDRQGNVADLRFRPVVDDPIWLLHSMSSQWQGETLELSGTYSYDLAAAHIARSDRPDPPLRITLRPADEVADCPDHGS